MVKIARFAKQHIPQAVGTPGVDPEAGAAAKSVAKLAGAVRENFQQQKKIADQATASKFDQEATIEYNKRIAEIKATGSDDPEKMINDIQDAGNEIFGRFSEGISSPEIKNSFLARGNSSVKTQTVSAMAWSSKQQGKRARADLNKLEDGFVLGAGSSPDVNVFNSDAINYRNKNKGVYEAVVGPEKGATQMNKALGDSAERYLQSKVSENPFQAFTDIEGGKLDKYLSSEDINKWKGRAESAMKTVKKDEETKVVANEVMAGTALGRLFRTGEAKASDVENHWLKIKDNKNIPQEYTDSVEGLMEAMYKGEKASPDTKQAVYDGLNDELTLMLKSTKDPDMSMPTSLRYRAKINKSFTRGLLTKSAYAELSNQATELINRQARNLTGADEGGIAERAIRGIRGRLNLEVDGPKMYDIETKAYANIDDVLKQESSRAIFKGAPKGFADKIGVDMKIDFNSMVIALEAKNGRMLTTQEYNFALRKAKEEGRRAMEASIFRAPEEGGL